MMNHEDAKTNPDIEPSRNVVASTGNKLPSISSKQAGPITDEIIAWQANSNS